MATMKVFEVKGVLDEIYATDCAVVAAENEKQAYDMAVKALGGEDSWYRFITFEQVKESKYSHIEEIKDLEYKGTEPKILSATSYVE